MMQIIQRKEIVEKEYLHLGCLLEESFPKVTKEIIEAFVDKVLIYDPEHIEIQWKFPDEVIKFIEE